MLTCAWCGATVDNTPLSWTLEITRGRSRYMCDRCSRENLAAIEGRLETEPY
jgi:DNA-directed RNA polymerase subunit RPC12/RpoP